MAEQSGDVMVIPNGAGLSLPHPVMRSVSRSGAVVVSCVAVILLQHLHS